MNGLRALGFGRAVVYAGFCAMALSVSAPAQTIHADGTVTWDGSKIPPYDSGAACRAHLAGLAKFGLHDGPGVYGRQYSVYYNQCLEPEQMAYDHLKSVWDQVPQDARAACIRQVTQPNGRRPNFPTVYYQYLSQCIGAAASQYTRPQFQP
jgi:hypothetical protein